MKLRKLFLVISSLSLLAGCNVASNSSISGEESSSETPSSSTSSSSEADPLSINNVNVYVYGANNSITINNLEEGETVSYTYSGDNIRIEDDKVIGLRGGSETIVTVTSNKGRTGTFKAKVRQRDYVSTHAATEESEGWFNDVDIDEVTSMTTEFANGMDISSLKQLYDNGQKFYDKDGKETSLLLILKDAGVNWIRLRLWNKPYDVINEGTPNEKKVWYGGGNCTKENMAWIAHEAKACGLKVLLNFHYSDFWTDPSHQIVPKDWVNFTTSDQMADAIYTFTKETLEYFEEQEALPDAVALGNEIYGGMLFHNPGTTPKTSIDGQEPNYSTGRTERSSVTNGRYSFTSAASDNVNLRKYLQAGIDAVNDVDDSILKMVHFVKGLTLPDVIKTFFDMVDDLDFDIYGLSAYVYFHYSNKTTLINGINSIASRYPDKKICIAENSYGFTYETDSYASNAFAAENPSGSPHPVSSYAVNIQGQANMIKDASEVIANLSNGFGCFYWEGAWTPTKKSGWTDEASKVSWANQGLFSYNGKALGSLEVYNKMLGN